jgi:hypothetical protein
VAMCLLLGGVYTLVGVLIVEIVLRSARRNAALSLA